jgi:hypothetical protein
MGIPGASESGESADELAGQGEVLPAHSAEAVDDLSDHLHQLLERLGYAEYAGVEADYERSSVYLYWKGELPLRLTDGIHQLENAELVEIKSAPYSPAEIDAEIRRILSETSATREAIAAIGPADDYSHIVIQPRRGVAPEISIESVIPIEVAEPTEVEEAARHNDGSPLRRRPR